MSSHLPTPERRPRSRRTVLLGWLTGALVLVLAACSGSGSSDSEAEDSGGGDSVSGPAVADESGGAGAEEAPALGGDEAGNEDTATDREVITTGYATVVADDPVQAASDLSRLVEEAGGRVERRSETAGTDGSPASASLTVRVPADRMTSAVEALSDLGDVEDVQVDSEDVTGQARDLDARIAALQTSTSRLRELMGEAGDTGDLLEIERELSQRQADLDALTAQRQRLADEVAMSTLEVELVSEPVAVAQSRGGFLGGLASGWGALVTTVQTIVLVLGVLLPWLALSAVGFLAYRWLRRRSRPAQPSDGGEAGGPGDTPDDGSGPSPDRPDDHVATDEDDDEPAPKVPTGATSGH